MGHIMHMCISVRGVLSRTDAQLKRELGGCITNDAGKKLYSAMEIREAFFDELAKGHEVIPFGECDNFDYKTGCRGHETTEKEDADHEAIHARTNR